MQVLDFLKKAIAGFEAQKDRLEKMYLKYFISTSKNCKRL